MKALHFLICDDHALMRQALVSTLRQHWPEAKISVATDFPGAERLAVAEVDLCICDMKMPGADPITGISKLMKENGPRKFIAISGSCDQATVDGVLKLGVDGIFDKMLDGNAFETAIRAVLDGGKFVSEVRTVEPAAHQELLTDRQLLIMQLLCAGKSNKEIAKELSIAPSTVKFHVDSILHKLGAKNRAEAVNRFHSASAKP